MPFYLLPPAAERLYLRRYATEEKIRSSDALSPWLVQSVAWTIGSYRLNARPATAEFENDGNMD